MPELNQNQFFHATNNVYEPGTVLRSPDEGVEGRLSHRYDTNGKWRGRPVENRVELEGGSAVPRTSRVWLTRDHDEALDWGINTFGKSDVPPPVHTYEVRPLGGVDRPVEPHSPTEHVSPRAEVVRRVSTVTDEGGISWHDHAGVRSAWRR